MKMPNPIRPALIILVALAAMIACHPAFAAGPAVLIQVNGSDSADLTTADTPDLTITLDVGPALIGTSADWFLVADTPDGVSYFDATATPAGWADGVSVTLQAELTPVSDLAVPGPAYLTAGSYTFHFGIDLDQNGDLDTASLVHDSATLSVTEALSGLVLNSADAYEGYTLFSPIASTTTYLMDNAGNFLHSWPSTHNPGVAVYLKDDGNLVRTADLESTTFDAGGAGGRIEEIDKDGNVVWEFEYAGTSYLLHHDIEVLPSGNILAIAWEMKDYDECVAAGRNPSDLSDNQLWPDTIIEIQPTGTSGGTIVWEWHVWDHLIQDYDSTKSNYGVVEDNPGKVDINYLGNGTSGGEDWTHFNSVDYNAEFDQVMVSVHGLNEIWIIDHSTTTAEAATSSGGTYGKGGDLLYRWGNPEAYGQGDSDDQMLFSQHDATWIESGLPGEGNILVYNNGKKRPDGNYSSVDEISPPVNADGSYTLDTSGKYAPQDLTWTFSDASWFYSKNISGAQRLANGNTLVCSGQDGTFFEVTSANEVVWKYINPVEEDTLLDPGESPTSNRVFKIHRYDTDYSGLPF